MEHWTAYWNQNTTLNSFAEGQQAEGYSGGVLAYWNSVFSTLPSCTKLLDVGTGNGALAVLANTFRQQRDLPWAVTGLDAAKINPFAAFQHLPEVLKKLEGINFLGETPIENTSLSSESFDFLCSQFGFEYSDINKATLEILRLLKPGGRFVALCHHKESSLTRSCGYGAEAIDYVLNKTPIFALTDVVVKLATQALPQCGDNGWKKNNLYQTLTQSIGWMLDNVSTQFPLPGYCEWINDISARVSSVLENCNQARIADLGRFLAFHHKELRMQKERLSEQCRAALDDKDIQFFEEFLADKRCSFKFTAMNFEEGVKVWEIDVKRL